MNENYIEFVQDLAGSLCDLNEYLIYLLDDNYINEQPNENQTETGLFLLAEFPSSHEEDKFLNSLQNKCNFSEKDRFLPVSHWFFKNKNIYILSTNSKCLTQTAWYKRSVGQKLLADGRSIHTIPVLPFIASLFESIENIDDLRGITEFEMIAFLLYELRKDWTILLLYKNEHDSNLIDYLAEQSGRIVNHPYLEEALRSWNEDNASDIQCIFLLMNRRFLIMHT